ncbi:hypothetical protein BGW38_002817 [Lunasporangiospora selenospora]|uniref:Uncharacterized protein n=1 Tax=Lunasporangiospora selenospora TaxID=979761 RepID=A0A9P6FSQ5_9FUNG|nr:hypothetical protein BGW38_002817 [Lunasporangiospora selenospora]
MRPDPHKQAASRKYHSKVRARGGSVAGSSSTESTSQGNHRGRGSNRRGGRGNYLGRNNDRSQNSDEGADDSDEGPRKSYARRKITSNVDRYIEKEDEDQKKTFDPAAYFRFKSEQEVEAVDPLEDSQSTRKLLEIRLDDIEQSLMTLSIKERLYLRESDATALDQDSIGKVSFTTGKPIVPKLVRGQAAEDMLIKPSAASTKTPGVSMGNPSKPLNEPVDSAKQAAMDAELDELLDISVAYGSSKKPPVGASSQKGSMVSSTPSTKPPPSSKSSIGASSGPRHPLPSPGSKGVKPAGSPVSSSSSPMNRAPPLAKKGPPAPPKGKQDEEWLDSVLGL